MMDSFNDIYGEFYIPESQFDSVIAGEKTHTDRGWKIAGAQVQAMKKGKLPKPLTGFSAFWSRTVSLLEPVQLRGRYERTGYFYYKKSFRHNLATFLFYGILFLFSFPGFFFLYRTNKQVFVVLISVIIIYTLVHALTIPYTNWRYRLPLDAIFMIVGWLGIVNIYRATINKLNKQGLP
jgi:hypothetical protein